MVSHSRELFSRAQRYIPGGVNSPVRAFGSVGGEPFFVGNAIAADRLRLRRCRVGLLCRLRLREHVVAGAGPFDLAGRV